MTDHTVRQIPFKLSNFQIIKLYCLPQQTMQTSRQTITFFLQKIRVDEECLSIFSVVRAPYRNYDRLIRG